MRAPDVDSADPIIADMAAAAAMRGASPDEESLAQKRAYVRRIFSEIAPRYDFLNHVLSLNVDRSWRRRAVAALDWRRAPSGRYLDLCAGTLDVASMLAGETEFRGSVVGADFAEPMLRAGIRKSPRDRVSAVAADALALPLPNDSMAGAIAAFGIRNVASLDGALREAHRVLAAGGRLVVLEFTIPDSPFVRWAYHLYFHHVLPLVGGFVSGHRTAYRYLPSSVLHFPRKEELGGRMRAAGFTDVRWDTLTFGIAAIHSGRKC